LQQLSHGTPNSEEKETTDKTRERRRNERKIRK
jgi:hypothetical protein